MDLSPAAIAALCDDLTQWRDRIQTAIGNDSLGWQSFGCEVFDDADRLFARLRMVENAGPLADAIDAEMYDSWNFVTMNLAQRERPEYLQHHGISAAVEDERIRQHNLRLCRSYGEGVKRRITNALAAVEQLRPDAPPNANPTSPQQTPEAAADDELREPQDCEKAAYYAFRYAEMKLQRTLKTQEAHEFWTEHGFDSADRDTENADVLQGYEITSLATFRSQLSRARRAFKDLRNEDRTGRSGRSVVDRGDLD